jgi:BioD-like phosphotransacetylase family protein
MILCVGIGDGHTAGDENVALPYLMELVRAYDAPVMLVQGGTRPTNDLIHGFTAKLNINDTRRVDAAISHYEPHLDFDAILAS